MSAQGFDTHVHFLNPKSGQIDRSNPYVRHCSQEFGVRYERDGKLYFEDGSFDRDVTPENPAPGAKPKTAVKAVEGKNVATQGQKQVIGG